SRRVSASRSTRGSERTLRDGAITMMSSATADAPTTRPTTNPTTGAMGPGWHDASNVLRTFDARVVEWQTRRTQNPVLARACGFKSHVGHPADQHERARRFAAYDPAANIRSGGYG